MQYKLYHVHKLHWIDVVMQFPKVGKKFAARTPARTVRMTSGIKHAVVVCETYCLFATILIENYLIENYLSFAFVLKLRLLSALHTYLPTP